MTNTYISWKWDDLEAPTGANDRLTMCGRFTLKTPVDDWIQSLFPDPNYRPVVSHEFRNQWIPRYNIAPTQPIPILRINKEGVLELGVARWGLVPFWADSLAGSYSMFNARSETLLEKASFKNLIREHRCAVVADGYYEWKTVDSKTKIPHWIHRPNEVPFAMAGLWTVNKKVSDLPIESATVITVPSNEDTQPVHDRMPSMLLSGHEVQQWLSPTLFQPNDSGLDLRMIASAPEGTFQWRHVGRAVGNARSEGADLIEPTP